MIFGIHTADVLKTMLVVLYVIRCCMEIKDAYPFSRSNHNRLGHSIDSALHCALVAQFNQQDPEVGATQVQGKEPSLFYTEKDMKNIGQYNMILGIIIKQCYFIKIRFCKR